MNDKELILIANLLDHAAGVFTNHKCNDVPATWFLKWSKEEMEELGLDVWNNDCSLMLYFAEKITEEIEGKNE